MNRRNFLKNAGIAGGILATTPLLGNEKALNANYLQNNKSNSDKFKLIDLHVHVSDKFSIEDIVSLGKEKNIRFGVVENVAPWGLQTDEDLKKHFDTLLPHPVYVGLQPMSPGWTKGLSSELIAKADYVIMDPQVLPNGNRRGELLYLWELGPYIDDVEFFMEQYFAHTLNVINNPEPLDILGWPLYLPGNVARDYYKLWTKKRMQEIIFAAKKRGIAIEINDTAHTPHEEFILMAKRQGLKFTFGSDTRDPKMGRLDYCKSIAKKCGLTQKDFFVPKRVI